MTLPPLQMDPSPCRTCREQHKKCDGERPCERCAKAGRLCEEPIKKKRGRPRLDAAAVAGMPASASGALERLLSEEDRKEPSCLSDYNYEVQDPRLVASLSILLSIPETIFASPVEAAKAFGERNSV